MNRTKERSVFPVLMSFLLLGCISEEKNKELIFSTCDQVGIAVPKREEPSVSLTYWTSDSSFEDFFQKKRNIWSDSKAWREKKGSIQDEPILKCISEKIGGAFLYIPRFYFFKVDLGWEYFKFYLVNTTDSTLTIPALDSTIATIESEISVEKGKWTRFQAKSPYSGFVCGNSFWELKLDPGEYLEIHLESDFVGFGDTTVNYRIQLALGTDTLISNSIPVNLFGIQLKVLAENTAVNTIEP